MCGGENGELNQNQPGHPQTFNIMQVSYDLVLGVKSTMHISVALC